MKKGDFSKFGPVNEPRYEAEVDRKYSSNPMQKSLTVKNPSLKKLRPPRKRSPDKKIYISVLGSMFLEERIIWWLNRGCWPIGKIEHINGDKSDNRLANLREKK